MKILLKLILLIFLLPLLLFSQMNQDARMLGLNGSYTTLASGYRCVGINPANIAVYQNFTMNIMNSAMGFSNNFFSLTTYNDLNGAHFEDTLSFKYYPKSEVLDLFGGRGIRINQELALPFPLLNISTSRFAYTSNLNFRLDMGIPNAFMDLFLFGNPIGKEFSIDLEEFIFLNQELGFTYGQSFKGFSAGVSLKYLMGLFYMGLEPADSSFIKTDISSFHGKSQYLFQQAIGGGGLGLDIGFTTDESKNGWRFGLSVINLLGTIRWTQDNFIRSRLETTIANSTGDFYLRPNELLYYAFIIDSINALAFSERPSDSLMWSVSYPVVMINDSADVPWDGLVDDMITIGEQTVSSMENIILLSNGKYLVPSENLYDSLANDETNPYRTRQPLYFRMGVSRHWPGQAVVAADIVTGFSNRLGSSSSWRLSIGAEIQRFNNKFLRIGYAFGGVAGKSMSLGYGRKYGPLRFDLGFSFKGGFKIDTAKGFDFASGITWQTGGRNN